MFFLWLDKAQNRNWTEHYYPCKLSFSVSVSKMLRTESVSVSSWEIKCQTDKFDLIAYIKIIHKSSRISKYQNKMNLIMFFLSLDKTIPRFSMEQESNLKIIPVKCYIVSICDYVSDTKFAVEQSQSCNTEVFLAWMFAIC